MSTESWLGLVGMVFALFTVLRRLSVLAARDSALDQASFDEWRDRQPRVRPPDSNEHVLGYRTADGAHRTHTWYTPKLSGQSVPTMPRPSPAARCQWCRVKLTHGECVDGCGGHQ